MPARFLSTVGTLMSEIADRLNILSASEEDNIVRDINNCTFDVQASFPNAPFLQTSARYTLSAGTSEYALASDLEKMYSIRYPDGNIKLVFLPTEQFDTFIPDSALSGSPTIYTIINSGTSIKYAPIPNAAIDIEQRYQRRLGTVSAESATPPLPTKYLELYALYGEFRGLRRQQRYQEAASVEVEYERKKKTMIDDLNEMTSENINIRSVREFTGGTVDYGDPIKNIYGNRDLP